MILAEEIGQRLDHHGADAVDGVEFGQGLEVAVGRLLHGIVEVIPRTISAGEHLGVAFADVADAQAEDQAMQVDLPARLDAVEEIPDRRRAEAGEVGEAVEAGGLAPG